MRIAVIMVGYVEGTYSDYPSRLLEETSSVTHAFPKTLLGRWMSRNSIRDSCGWRTFRLNENVQEIRLPPSPDEREQNNFLAERVVCTFERDLHNYTASPISNDRP